MRGEVRPVSRALTTLSVFVFCFWSVIGWAAEPRVLFVDTDIYDSSLLITTDRADTDATIALSDCQVGPVPTATVGWGETVLIGNIARYQCDGDVGLLTLRTIVGSANVSTLVTFRDPFGNIAHYEVPALEYDLEEAGVLQAKGILNDGGRFRTALILFNEGDEPVYISAEIFEGMGYPIGVESFSIEPGSYTLHELETPVRAGRVEIREGLRGIGCAICQNTEPVFGFASVIWSQGGSPRIVTLEPVVLEASMGGREER